MSVKPNKTSWRLPAMLMLAVIVVLAMLRLAVWQLDRAEQKRHILGQLQSRASMPPLSETALANHRNSDGFVSEFRYRSVALEGEFLPDRTLFVDRQVHQSQVGYLVVTPFRPRGAEYLVLVARGWVSAGADRQVLPIIETPDASVAIAGRLNVLTPPPPLWDEKFSPFDGSVWQYLPQDLLAKQMASPVLPLMLELAPTSRPPIGLDIEWAVIDDHWVAKHSAYAFQWFAMAAAFTLAVVVLLVRRRGEQ